MPALPPDFPSKHREDWLHVHELKHGGIYLCYARGARVAIFGGNGFFVPKQELGLCVLEPQRHWNDVSPHGTRGTVKPLELLDLGDLMAIGPAAGRVGEYLRTSASSFVTLLDIEPHLDEVFAMDEHGESFVNDSLFNTLKAIESIVMNRWKS